MGGVSDLITRLERDSASMSCRTAKTTSPVLKVITRGSEPPADGSMNLVDDDHGIVLCIVNIPEREEGDDQDDTDRTVKFESGCISRVGPEGSQQQRGSTEKWKHCNFLIQNRSSVKDEADINVNVVVLSSSIVIVDPSLLGSRHQRPGTWCIV